MQAENLPLPLPNSALVMVEFQNEWLDPAGKLHHLFQNADLLLTAKNNAELALHAAREADIPVIHTSMGYSDDYAELGQSSFGIRGAISHFRTWQGWNRQHANNFQPNSGEFVIDRKVAASAFAATTLDFYLRNNHIQRIYLAGFALHVCISATGWAAHDLGYEVVVLKDACAAFDKDQQEFVLQHVVHHFGKTQSTSQFTQSLETL